MNLDAAVVEQVPPVEDDVHFEPAADPVEASTPASTVATVDDVMEEPDDDDEFWYDDDAFVGPVEEASMQPAATVEVVMDDVPLNEDDESAALLNDPWRHMHPLDPRVSIEPNDDFLKHAGEGAGLEASAEALVDDVTFDDADKVAVPRSRRRRDLGCQLDGPYWASNSVGGGRRTRSRK